MVIPGVLEERKKRLYALATIGAAVVGVVFYLQRWEQMLLSPMSGMLNITDEEVYDDVSLEPTGTSIEDSEEWDSGDSGDDTLESPSAAKPKAGTEAGRRKKPSAKSNNSKGGGSKGSSTKKSRRQKRAAKKKKEEKVEGVGWMKAMFDSMDANHNGAVTVKEVVEHATKWNLPHEYVMDFVKYADQDKDEVVSFDDFMNTIRTREMMINKACQPYEIDPDSSVLAETWARGQWLLGLMVLQSVSGVILQRYENLIKQHVVITFFLTMLVGAGGNAGNQSTIKVIEGMAKGELEANMSTFIRVMMDQFYVGILLSIMMTMAGFVRVFITNGRKGNTWQVDEHGFIDCIAISLSLCLITLSSVMVGTMLPFALVGLGVDAANAGPTVQVLMDILGVIVACTVCKTVLSDWYGIRISLGV